MIVIDMDMPESCNECPLFDNEYLHCQKTKERCETWAFEPTKSCPIKCDIEQIRAELHATAEMHDDGDYYLRDKWVDEIIDKYAKGEGK